MDLEEAFSQAAEIAKKMPQHLQEAAFNRALDQLLSDSTPRSRPGKGQKKSYSPGSQSPKAE